MRDLSYFQMRGIQIYSIPWGVGFEKSLKYESDLGLILSRNINLTTTILLKRTKGIQKRRYNIESFEIVYKTITIIMINAKMKERNNKSVDMKN